jgi:hypothetical protein
VIARLRAHRLLLAAVAGVVALAALVLVVAIGSGTLRPFEPDQAAASPTPSPTEALPSPSAPTTGIAMPVGDDCLACHLTNDGGIGTRVIPALAHPLEGWTECTACHAPDRLVQTAPGHDGIHAEQCLSCHKDTSDQAPDRPHPPTQSQGCLTCHGVEAPLPSSMAGRSETTCWLCHQSSEIEAPHFLHPLSTDQTCTSCHSAGEAGALPPDHAGRSDATCTDCHQQSTTKAPVAPHDLASRAGMCAFCHSEATGSD